MVFLYSITVICIYDGLTSILPTIAIIIYTSSLWQDDTMKIGYGSAIIFSMLIIYNILVGAYTSGIVNIILLASSIASIIKDKRTK